MIITSTSPPYATGTCKVHVRQTLGDTLYEANVYLDVQIFDNNGAEIGSNQGDLDWGEGLVVGRMLTDPLNESPQHDAVDNRSEGVEKIGGVKPNGRPFQAWDTSSSQYQGGG